MVKKTDNPKTMEELLASLSNTPLNFERGLEVEGEVVSISESEIIIDLGTKSEGVLNARDLTPELKSKLKIGDKIKAIIQDNESESGQVLLTVQKAVKARTETGGFDKDKWEQIASKYKKDGTFKGTVAKITQFGVFVKLEDGVEGLIHASNLGPNDQLIAGQEISVTIDSLDSARQRISLSPVITSTKGLIYK